VVHVPVYVQLQQFQLMGAWKLKSSYAFAVALVSKAVLQVQGLWKTARGKILPNG